MVGELEVSRLVHVASSSPQATGHLSAACSPTGVLLGRTGVRDAGDPGKQVVASGPQPPPSGPGRLGRRRALVRLAHASDAKVFPMVQNYRDGAFQGGDLKLLASATGRQTLVAEIVQAVIDAGADGVNLDLEQLTPTLTMAFVNFVAELYGRLHGAGKAVIVDIPVDHRSYDVPRCRASPTGSS